ncbi:MAG: metal ABC transporter substrate-binding protein [Vicinamibacterales bacterium]
MFVAGKHPTVALVPAAIVSLLIVACGGGGGASTSGDKIQVVTTLPLFADFVREVGGDRVQVTSLIPAGVNPDSWQPAPSDAERIADADIAFANGRDLDTAAIDLLQLNLPQNAPLVQIASDDEELEKLGAEVFRVNPGEFEQPVLWMSIQNGKAYAQFIRIQLTQLDPDGEADYSRNAESYFEQIDETERYAFHVLDSIPPDNKKLISANNEIEYFANYYALELTAQLSRYPGHEPTDEDVERIKQKITERDVLAVFVQPYSNLESELLRQAGEDAGVQVCTLYSDSLDDKVSTYIDLIRFDAEELARCLGGETT